MLTLGAVLVAIMIGLRYEVGGDWNAYERIFAFAGIADFGQVMTLGDPGYQLLNWLAHQANADIWLVNLMCGFIFAWGLLAFARVQPMPWLAFVVAVPYLIVVVAMGFSRQAVAIGILLAGLARLERGGGTVRFAVYVVIAALFHRTAIIALPLVVLSADRNRLLNVVLTVGLTVVLYDVFLSNSADRLVTNYITAKYNAQGAAVRVAMSIVPAAVFLLQQRRFGFAERERKTWRNFSLAAFVLLALLFILPSSAVIDRLALYVTPLQVAVLSRVPVIYRSRQLATLMIVIYSFAVQFVWMNYAAHAGDWIPYRLFPFGG